MKTVSIKFLEAQIERLNTLTNSPATLYALVDGRNVAQIGCYHLSGAYGGQSLHRITGTTGGVLDVFSCGHITKRDLSDRIAAFIAGIQSK